ncbi:MAG: tetratricopeptide repeat protein [Phycisphaerae bacterium]|nr:tetratricopeptide repeat protein [Phycisphaerae bacterium]
MDANGDLAGIFGQETFDQETYAILRGMVYGSGQAHEQFLSLTRGLRDKLRGPDTDDRDGALKMGICCYLLGRHKEAMEWLAGARDVKEKRYYLGECLRATGQPDKAVAEFDRAAGKGWEEFDCQLRKVACCCQSGNLAEAEKILSSLAKVGAQKAEWHHQYGCFLERQGQTLDAISEFERAIALDENHAGAMFRLAYAVDLRGEENRAIELYQRCVSRPPVHVNALMNLAVLYEDHGRFEDAEACLRQVLGTNPNHARARMFLKDVRASMHMIIDEEQERVRERRNAVLDIPVTDFELSVRSRNCLKKMNINTLGDLLRITEAELLGYKNFGETSLNEIKAMLSQKGLRLGQAMEEQRQIRRPDLSPSVANVSPDILNKTVSELDLSVRSRKCLQRLNIATLGELASRTEAELLGTRNFGQTSLNEIKERLSENGLSLRNLEG